MYQEREIEEMLKQGLGSLSKLLKVERSLIMFLKYDHPQSRRDHEAELPLANLEGVYQWSRDLGEVIVLPNDVGNFRLSECLLCQAAFNQAPEPLAIANSAQLSPFLAQGTLPEIFNIPSLASLCVVPIMGQASHNRETAIVLGFILFLNTSSRQWLSEEFESMNWFATVTSKVVVERRTQQRVQSLIDDRTAQLQFMLGMQVKLTEKRQQQIDNLKRLNQFKDDLIANVSDALKTPLASMTMAIKLLKVSMSEEKRQRNLEILEKECAREIQLVDDLLTLQKIQQEPEPIPFRKINLRDLIEGFAQSFTQDYGFKQLAWVIDYPKSTQLTQSTRNWQIDSDMDSLKRILHELFKNAGQYAVPQTTIHIQIEEQSLLAGSHLVLMIKSLGQGILPEEQTEIFNAFQRGSNVNRGSNQGLGIGLTIAKILVEHLNGTIGVISHPVAASSYWETTFTLTMPRFQA